MIGLTLPRVSGRARAARSLALCLALLGCATAPRARAQPPATPPATAQPAATGEPADPLAPVAFLEGGTWRGEGKWPDGSLLRVEQRFHWGPTRRVLHFDAYGLASGARTLLYEGLLFRDGRRGKLVQWNFKPDGELTETEVTRVNGDGYEVQGPNSWSIIRKLGADEFGWELRVKQGDQWKPILNATFSRER